MKKVMLATADRAVQIKRIIFRNFTSSYQDSILALKKLKTPTEVYKQIAELGGFDYPLRFQKSLKYIQLAGLEEERLNSLNVIHISGTKGKGSTGALCESILRHCGLKTGFFSSPHLIEPRERIRINGNALPKQKFASYFNHYFNILNAKKDEMDGEPPTYFCFLTIMGFHAFLEEKVDVAIVEVGMGGEYDATNVITRPVVCGITTLDFDHVKQLGSSLGDIAWHKAGIFKPCRPAYTVPQEQEAMQVMRERSCQIRVASLNVVPRWHECFTQQINISMAGEHQKLNASLALQLCRRWLIEKDQWADKNARAQGVSRFTEGLPISFKDGIEKCRWPGRNQVVYRDHMTYYLDVAHTIKSIKAASNWFKSAAVTETTKLSGNVARALIFNLSADRDFTSMLNILKECDFNFALFCPNLISTDEAATAWQDMANLTVDTAEQLAKCNEYEQQWKNISPSTETGVLPSVKDTAQWLNRSRERSGVHLQVLVCGSVSLVGVVMASLNLTADDLYV